MQRRVARGGGGGSSRDKVSSVHTSEARRSADAGGVIFAPTLIAAQRAGAKWSSSTIPPMLQSDMKDTRLSAV